MLMRHMIIAHLIGREGVLPRKRKLFNKPTPKTIAGGEIYPMIKPDLEVADPQAQLSKKIVIEVGGSCALTAAIRSVGIGATAFDWKNNKFKPLKKRCPRALPFNYGGIGFLEEVR